MNTLFIKAGLNWISDRTGVSLFMLVLISCLSTAVLMQPVQAANVRWLTLVSLTFDDGLKQSLARDILASHGMQGTFYVNSNLIGSGGNYLTNAELDALYVDGNDIGGHTIGHVHLDTLSDADQQAAICNDMQNLVNWGYEVHSFAFPYGASGPTTQSILEAGCPGIGNYESARTVGGLVTGTECFNCPWAESLPPANPYYINTNSSVISTTTLEDLKSYVMQAEANGGGWVPLVFHRICDGCSIFSVSPAIFDAFLTWLEQRGAQDTYVRTVHQVMVGDYPAPPPPPQLGPNVLINPSLEIDSNNNNQADCWQRSSFGSNKAKWKHVNDPLTAHSGSFSEQLTITSYNSGDRKLLPSLDAGQAAGECAPNVAAGDVYQFSAWYKSTVPSTMVLFYLDESNNWQYWRDGPLLSSTVDWTQTIYYPGVVPAGAKAISFGIALSGTGTMITDDYSMQQVLDSPPPIDTIPPVISGLEPADGTIVTGNVSLTAIATDNVALQRVEFLIDDTLVATDTTKPYAVIWDSRSVANKLVNYTVRAVDFAGNETISEIRTLTTENDLAPPVISFDQPPTPAQDAIVSGLVPLAATATDDIAVTRVDFLVNGSVVGSGNVSPYTATWNSLLNPDGPASLTARAFDAAGNNNTSNVIKVTVNNNGGNLLTNPSLEIDADNNGIADCWLRGGYGTNTYIWTRLGPGQGHTGDFAESLQMTSRTSGDRKLLPTLDSGICAPAVTEGTRYTLSSWYKSNVTTGFVVFYQTTAGVWKYWQTSSNFPAAVDWAQATYITPPIPAGAKALSFGLYLKNVGTLVTDDYSMITAP